MKFLIIGDLHGRMPNVYFKDFDAIIAVGDFCSDDEMRKYYKEWFAYLKEFDAGNTRQKPVSYDEFIESKISEDEFENMEKRSLGEGRKILEFLNSFGKPVFIVPGNWDQSYGNTRILDTNKSSYNRMKSVYDSYLSDKTNSFLTKGLENIYDCQYKCYEFDEFNILGYGLSSNSEELEEQGRLGDKKFRMLKDAYDKIVCKLDLAFNKANKKKPTIFISHNVPYGTKLDVVKNKDSYANNMHVGSTVAMNACKKHKPLLCVGGHVHEHFGKTKIGKTTVVNAGFGEFKNVFLEVKDNKICKLEFFDGEKKKRSDK